MSSKTDIGQIFRMTVSVLRANASAFLLFTGLMAVVTKLLMLAMGLDHVLVEATSGAGNLAALPGGPIVGTASLLLIAIVPYLVALSAISHGTAAFLAGTPVTVGECIAVSVRRMPEILLLGVVAGLGVFLAGMFLVIPAVILIVLWYVAPPVLIIERVGVMRSLGRSIELTRGHRLMIFGLIFVLMVVTFLVSALVSSIFLPFGILPAQIAAVAIDAVLSAVGAVACSVTYCALAS
ncbi:MAG: hypothetical protein RIM33_12445 [Alphaproteobacteria bacterium]